MVFIWNAHLPASANFRQNSPNIEKPENINGYNTPSGCRSLFASLESILWPLLLAGCVPCCFCGLTKQPGPPTSAMPGDGCYTFRELLPNNLSTRPLTLALRGHRADGSRRYETARPRSAPSLYTVFISSDLT